MRYQPGESALDIDVCADAPDTAKTLKNAGTHNLKKADKTLGIRCSRV